MSIKNSETRDSGGTGDKSRLVYNILLFISTMPYQQKQIERLIKAVTRWKKFRSALLHDSYTSIGLSLRKAANILSDCFIKRNHVSIWNWIQKYNTQRISSKKKKISEYVIDETVIKVGSEYVWV